MVVYVARIVRISSPVRVSFSNSSSVILSIASLWCVRGLAAGQDSAQSGRLKSEGLGCACGV